MREKDYKSAMQYYNKALTENRTKDVLAKLQQCEKAIAEAERLAYIDPELSLQEKNKGNELYKAGTKNLAPHGVKHLLFISSAVG